jgi:hypothetical protein
MTSWGKYPNDECGRTGLCASGRSSRVFAPPIGPPDPVRCTSGLHDDPLIGGTERLGKTGQRGLDEPRFDGHQKQLLRQKSHDDLVFDVGLLSIQSKDGVEGRRYALVQLEGGWETTKEDSVRLPDDF